MAFNTEEILKAIQIISKSEINGLKLDKTIIAQISNIVNLETGEYKVEYEGNTFSAFSAIATTTYDVGNSVYVKIPQNDMSKRKVIEGIATGGEKTITNIVEQQTAVNKVGPNWDKFYGYAAQDTFGIVSGVNKNHRNFYCQIYPTSGSSSSGFGDAAFQNYAKTYKKIKISASFQTRFIAQHNKGNYGLIIGFRVNTVDNNGIDKVYYRLDMSNFVGSPYNYTTWAPQSVIIDVQDNYLLGLDSIILFQEDFDLDISRNYDGDIIYRNDGEDDNFNILVKDIELSFVELVDLTKTLYYLDIATPEGVSFITAADTLPLVGKLWHQGKDIMSSKSCKCYWYKQNLEVMIGHDKYDKTAGSRWELVSGDFNELKVKATEVPFRANYKLVVLYNDTMLSKEITLYRYNSDYDYLLVQETSGATISLKIQNNKDNKHLVGDWYFSLPDGSYSLITDGTKKNSIAINDYLLYTVIEFYCQVYDGNKLISIEHMAIKSSSQSSDVEVTYEGQDVYQYDANGDLAYQDTEVDRTLAAKVAWKEGFGSAYKITWLMGGTEIPFDRTKATNPADSMMENLWVDNYNILHYNIKQKYTVNYTNNIITIKITTVDGHEYSFEKEILFLKDGDQGTNGTTYICAIRPVNTSTGNKLTTNSALEYNSGWKKGINLRCFVYRDGDLINESSAYDIEYKWEVDTGVLNLRKITGLSDHEDYRVVTGRGSLDTAATKYLVKVTIKVKAKTSSDKHRWDDDTMIYCQYPLDVAVNGLNAQTLEMELPSYIKYTAAGTDPSYQKTTLVCRRGTTNAVFSSTNPGLFGFKDNTDKTGKVIDPTDKFLYREGIAAIKCSFGSQYLLHPVMMYLNTYGNETINGWDGTTLDIDEEGGHILAPQVGAGKKNADGTFTGVIMGRQTGVADNDVFGLYGYMDGISTFGLKENGTAYIGAAGEGQIIFDGTKNGIIKSGNYDGVIYDAQGNLVTTGSGKQGMKIELTEGHIDAYNFRISSGNMTLDSQEQQFLFKIGIGGQSYFRVCSTDETAAKTLFNVQANSYYLQTEDFVMESSGVKGKGTKIDLSKGKITSYDFTIKTPYMELSSDSEKGKFVFDVRGRGSFQIKGANKTLFNVSTSNYYLQTDNFDNAAGTGTKIDLIGGKITSYDFTIKTPYMELSSDGKRGKFKFNVSGNGSFEIIGTKESDLSEVTLFKVAGTTYYLQSANYNGGSGENLEGVYINLRTGQFKVGGNAEFNGSIYAKSGKIGGWNIRNGQLQSDDGSIYLSTSSGLKVGENFRVTQSGNMTASNATVKGTISADAGYIGAWDITDRALSCGSTILGTDGKITTQLLSATGGYIGGWQITATSLKSATGNVELRSNHAQPIHTTYGDIGLVTGRDDAGTTYNFGLDTTNGSGDQSIIIRAGRNIALRADSWIFLNANRLTCTVPAANQKGIYARFA